MKARSAPNLMFSHMGLSVKDIAPMEAFHVDVPGFTVTDRGDAEGMELVFLSRSPDDHHQIVPATDRPDTLRANTANRQFGPSINQNSFKLGSLDAPRDMLGRLQAAGGGNLLPANHGIACIAQPFLIPLDIGKSNEEIVAVTKSSADRHAHRPRGRRELMRALPRA